MTSQHDNPKRWRPRFSVRTLVIVVTLVCCYAACWGPTKSRGRFDVARLIYGLGHELTDGDRQTIGILVKHDDPRVLVPLIVRYDARPALTDGMLFYGEPVSRSYYFWFFGFVAKLPYERELYPEIKLKTLHGVRIRDGAPENWVRQ